MSREKLRGELGVQPGASDDVTAQALSAASGLMPSVKSTIDQMAKVAADPSAKDEDRQLARTNLERLATDAESPHVRDYALRISSPDPAASAKFSEER